MAGVKGKSGGKRAGAGRPSLGEQLKVRELLDEAIDPAFVTEKIFQLIDNGDYRAIDLYMKYRVGTPVQSIDMNVSGSTDINFNLSDVIKFKEED
jgi:hypothetical protein